MTVRNSVTSKKPPGWRESNDYRSEYFRKNPGLFGGLYICSQCYKPLVDKRNVEVDHIIPPSRFAKSKQGLWSKFVRFMMRVLGMKVKQVHRDSKTSLLSEAMNREWQTVAICSKCNKKKSDKMGFVTVKGFVAKIMELILFRGQALLVVVLSLLIKVVYWFVAKLFNLLSIPFKGNSAWYVKLGFVALYLFGFYYIATNLL